MLSYDDCIVKSCNLKVNVLGQPCYNESMVKIDLITGFLGSGKTTFLKKYAKHLIDSGENICILENDFGAVNVDMMMLSDLLGDCCELEMVAGGCDYDCHKRRFKTKLIAMGMCGYDRVIVEPSGIYDMDEFFDTLREDPLDRWYEITNVFAIVDAGIDRALSDTSRYLLSSQTAGAGRIFLSHTAGLSKADMEDTCRFLQETLASFKCNRDITDCIEAKGWDTFTHEDWLKIEKSGYHIADHVKLPAVEDNAYTSVYFMNLPITRDILQEKIPLLFSDSSFGNVIRVKGFFKENDSWILVNATRKGTSIDSLPDGQEVIIIIGEGLDEAAIDAFIRGGSVLE